MELFVDVLLPIPLEKLFTYSISKEAATMLVPGMRIAVPFGKSKIYTGLVSKVHTNPPIAYEAKEIHQILDTQPTVTKVQLELWEWMAAYYMCTLGEVFRSAVPSSFLLESETLILKNEKAEIEDIHLDDNEFLILEALDHQPSLKINDVSGILDRKTVLPVLHKMLDKDLVKLKEEVHEQYKPKMVRYIGLSDEFTSEEKLEQLLEDLSRAPAQSRVILTLFQMQAGNKKPIKAADLQQESGASAAIVKALVDKEILSTYFIRTDRVVYDPEAEQKPSKALNKFQVNSLQSIKTAFENNKVSLLHGVTSSGKTEVYVKLMEDCLNQHKQTLYLLPEIALTTQLIARLQEYFGEKIAVYHSKYSLNERVEVWNNVLNNAEKAQIVVGARSSLFLPFKQLGLVVIDEEHEGSFKQYDPAPRYHARDTAIMLAKLHGAQVLLGSATPSLESYYNVQTGKYGYTEMKERYGGVLMPEIQLVDIKEQTRKRRMKGHFSEQLINEITETLALGEQVILFQNRRGYAPIVECSTCGHSPQCPNCDVSLTYHKARKQLRCHYCGYQILLEANCMACGSYTLDTKGFGTEQIEKEFGEYFPKAKIGRMDLDTTRGKYAYQKIIHAFEKQELDVLVGTQMVTKGLDFRHVNLVGIMNADSLLNFPDFRAHERSFQLLTQVAGRAGRTKKRGKVLIQTYNPYHPILQQVVQGDYDGMFTEQLAQRNQYKYPPTNRIIKITCKHRDYNKVNEASAWFAKALRNVFGTQILGPEYPPVARIRNLYIKNMLVKIPKEQSLLQTKKSIKRIENSFNAIGSYKSVRIIYDVDYF